MDRYRVKGRMSERPETVRAWRYNRDGSPKYDSFMHSQQCEDYESLTPGCAVDYCSLANVPGTDCSRVRRGELVFYNFPHVRIDFEHEQCGCWCHRAAIDRDTPPDFLANVEDAQTFVSERGDDAVEVPFTPFDVPGEVVPEPPTPVICEAEPGDPLCELCNESMSVCDCVTYDETAKVFKNARGEVIQCEGVN